jgi:hypothetical protein
VRLAQRTSLLLLPASRADILIGGGQDKSDVTIFTEHVSMGAGPGDADEWPLARLGELSFAGNNVVPTDAAFEPQLRIPSELSTGASVKHLPEGCTRATLENSASKSEWRRIVLDSNDKWFFVGSSIVAKEGQKGEQATDLIVPRTMPMMSDENAWKTTKHICVKQGETELWEIVNRTNEIHNFHIHQSKFKVVKLIDPNNKLENYSIFNHGEAADANVWHDTFPVPPALTKDGTPDPNNPGRVFIVINFGAAQQVGRFVFHCHILEHEDKGMMAPIEVLSAEQ